MKYSQRSRLERLLRSQRRTIATLRRQNRRLHESVKYSQTAYMKLLHKSVDADGKLYRLREAIRALFQEAQDPPPPTMVAQM
eukprot:12934680-Prorocentrum_lima.AAC.1